MKHQDIDARSLLLARAVARKIDEQPFLLDKARAWAARQTAPAYLEWHEILMRTWPEIRTVLLDPSEEGKRLRQSSPFSGVLDPRERWAFFPVERD
jgi:hypothetical protein